MKKISIIITCYNEEETIPVFYKEMSKIITKMKKKASFELIFINDGSRDKTLDILRKLAKKDKKVKYISFSRNFFKEAGFVAGFEKAKGDYVVVMDVDLQDPPEKLIEMFDILEEGEYDIVATRRTTRKGEGFLVSLFSRWFYKVINALSETEIVDGARDYRMMKRKVVDAILSMPEYNRFSKGIFQWVGFKTKWLEYENIERSAGTTKLNFWKRFSYAIDGIVAFSTKPLVMATVVGFLFCLIAVIMIIFIIVRTLMYGDPVAGWPSLVCIIFFVGGMQLFCTGIIGQYLAKNYMETKKRPLYIIAETEEDLGK